MQLNKYLRSCIICIWILRNCSQVKIYLQITSEAFYKTHTQSSRPNSLHKRLDFKSSTKLSCLISHLLMVAWAEGRSPSATPTKAWDRWESWSCGHKSRRAMPNPHQLQHSGEQALYPTRAANRSNLLMEVRESHPRNHEHGTAVSISKLVDQPYSYPRPDPGLWLGLLQHPSTPPTPAGVCEGTWPADPQCRISTTQSSSGTSKEES